MPTELVVLNGSCVQIPCAFNIPEEHLNTFNRSKNVFGVWLKQSHKVTSDNVIYNSSKEVNIYQGNITGNMSQKNCTTVFFNVNSSYTNKYYFRIESERYSATDTEMYVNINVLESPQEPDIEVLGEIREGTPVSLNCSAVAPCPEHPPKLTWTLPTEFTHEDRLQENPDQTKSVLSTVTFIASYLHNNKNITCTAVYPVGTYNKTSEQTRTLHVLFSPKDTSASISPADPASVGSCVNLTCTSTANPPVTNFTWFRISGGNTTQVASRQNYTLNVTVGDGGQYYCEARNDLGFGKSQEVMLSIEGSAGKMQDMPIIWWIIGGSMVLVLLFLIVYLGWWRKSRAPDGLERTVNLPEPLPHEEPNQLFAKLATTREKPAEPEENLHEEIHYGEIYFSKQQPQKTQTAAQDRERDQWEECEYSEVKMTRRKTPDQDGQVNDLYAQVNKSGVL
ncbi:hypothetical protein DPEC_G00076390 [Dallia pectoralis]|uniref:Uncharacterized protein n=1 Tax=Dallia pectoralis TaxID=75939 RepID=A0ACC2H3S9_DALPE|nr:hypothetical protein DPEC_G00076390 [Dallia pectoralis]